MKHGPHHTICLFENIKVRISMYPYDHNHKNFNVITNAIQLIFKKKNDRLKRLEKFNTMKNEIIKYNTHF